MIILFVAGHDHKFIFNTTCSFQTKLLKLQSKYCCTHAKCIGYIPGRDISIVSLYVFWTCTDTCPTSISPVAPTSKRHSRLSPHVSATPDILENGRSAISNTGANVRSLNISEDWPLSYVKRLSFALILPAVNRIQKRVRHCDYDIIYLFNRLVAY